MSYLMLHQIKNTIDMRNHYLFKIRNGIRSYSQKLPVSASQTGIPQLVMITTFPPRECGIATYAQDLMKALNDKFVRSFYIKICALENEAHHYGNEVKYILETNKQESYARFTEQMNKSNVNLIMVQHEFGLFREHEKDLLQMLSTLKQPVIIVFHTVIPKPEEAIQMYIQNIAKKVSGIIVMTNDAMGILVNDYLIPKHKITMIPHGTHLVKHSDKEDLKQKYGYQGRKVLSTFGLLSSGKSIETTLHALPAICKKHPETLFLIIGKTHLTVAKRDGEEYRNNLLAIIRELKLEDHVNFINEYLPLKILLEYLQLTDIYLFTSKDPNQAVSGTFSYALSCGCPIISTPIPHAREVIQNGTGRIVDFESPEQLAHEVIKLLNDKKFRLSIGMNGLQEMAPTVWENSALNHVRMFKGIIDTKIRLSYKIPEINLSHLQKMTTDFGIIQFTMVNHPDQNSGYTLDDNARALIAMCQHYKMSSEKNDLNAIECYLDFILYCFQPDGYFVNYISAEGKITSQNKSCNLEDSSGRAIWALGYLLSLNKIMPNRLIVKAEAVFDKAILKVASMHSTRAMAFCIKGIYYANIKKESKQNTVILDQFATRMARMYEHEADKDWEWYESYLTYANSILPEAMLFAFLATGKTMYQSMALLSFDFLLSKIFTNEYLQVISNKGWLHNGQELNFENRGGEQPIDVAYTIMALREFYQVFKIEDYKSKMQLAFDWFLGKNHLNQIIYNPCTGGCYDGLENTHINLNQGAESTISYLLARLTIEPYQVDKSKSIKIISKKLPQDKIVSIF